MSNSQSVINQELHRIKAILEGCKDGASVEEIKEVFTPPIELRTLQRRLGKLQAMGIVQVSGQTRATRYHLVRIVVPEEVASVDKIESLIPLSPEGEKINQIVTQPEGKRKPVGYNTDFLLSYRPNVDSYLTAADKTRLAELGKTVRLDQPAGTYAREVLQRLLIDLSWNSSRLEGNTYSLLDTQRLISQGIEADGKTAKEAQMILNHKEAIEFIVQSVDDIGFNRYSIMGLHALLSNNLLPDPTASGRLRTFGIGITHSVYTPLSIPQQIEDMFDLMLAKTGQIENPFEQAFFIMVHLPYLQPFDDVNKRVSRLAANISLNKHNLAPLAFVDVPDDMYIHSMLGIYEINRIELLKDVYIWAYERSALRYAALRQSLGNPDPFRLKYREEIKELVAGIVLHVLPHEKAVLKIKQYTEKLPKNDQAKFVEVVDTELMSLHEGNIARYRIRPSQFKVWKEAWDSPYVLR